MRQGFGESADHQLNASQVRLVLEELHARVGLNDREAEVQQINDNLIADIAEATGFSIPMVCDAVERVRRTDRESELSRVLTELEEPTHRVERPGHAPSDPLSRHFPWANKKLTSSILDDVKRVDQPRRVIVERKIPAHEKALNWLSVIIVALLAGIAIFAILASMINR